VKQRLELRTVELELWFIDLMIIIDKWRKESLMAQFGILFLLLGQFTRFDCLGPRETIKNLNPESRSIELETSQIWNSSVNYWTKNENSKTRF
jgi:hypothetical protein